MEESGEWIGGRAAGRIYWQSPLSRWIYKFKKVRLLPKKKSHTHMKFFSVYGHGTRKAARKAARQYAQAYCAKREIPLVNRYRLIEEGNTVEMRIPVNKRGVSEDTDRTVFFSAIHLDVITRHTWEATMRKGVIHGVVSRVVSNKVIPMERLLTGMSKHISHRDGDVLNNRDDNLVILMEETADVESEESWQGGHVGAKVTWERKRNAFRVRLQNGPLSRVKQFSVTKYKTEKRAREKADKYQKRISSEMGCTLNQYRFVENGTVVEMRLAAGDGHTKTKHTKEQEIYRVYFNRQHLPLIEQFRWEAMPVENGHVAVRVELRSNCKMMTMHQLITKDRNATHLDGNGLNNRDSNLPLPASSVPDTAAVRPRRPYKRVKLSIELPPIPEMTVAAYMEELNGYLERMESIYTRWENSK